MDNELCERQDIASMRGPYTLRDYSRCTVDLRVLVHACTLLISTLSTTSRNRRVERESRDAQVTFETVPSVFVWTFDSMDNNYFRCLHCNHVRVFRENLSYNCLWRFLRAEP